MSAWEGSKLQERKEDEARLASNVKKSPVLLEDDTLINSALEEAGKILLCAFDLLGITKKVSAEIISGGKSYKLTFERAE